MSVIVKICGLREPATLAAALDAGADMVGFVYFERSPRHLAPNAARDLASRVEGRATKVLLTAGADDATLDAAIRAVAPDLLQLHGGETPERLHAIRRRFGLPVAKAIAIGTRDDFAQVAAYDEVSDWLLFDARPPSGADRPGGNATAFDWSLLDGLSARCRWLLAGGLDADNVGAALAASGALAVDVSSGVERAPGVKDAAMIRRFVAAARRGVGGEPLSRPARDGSELPRLVVPSR